MMTLSLDIKIVPCGDNADLHINGKHYIIDTAALNSEADLRSLVADQPDYIAHALSGLLKEMA